MKYVSSSSDESFKNLTELENVLEDFKTSGAEMSNDSEEIGDSEITSEESEEEKPDKEEISEEMLESL